MFSCRFCLFYVVTILCLCVGSSHTEKCARTDRQALLMLKDGFIHGKNILSSWKGEDCCKWKGISCNNLTGHVTRLDLRFSENFPVLGAEDGHLAYHWLTMEYSFFSPALGGKIDSSICKLQHLTFLDLSINDLEGEIPKCIGSLGQLIELKLAMNELVSSIPHTLANLSNLRTLDLRDNYLVVNDLEWLSHLSNLRYLGLSENNLSRVVDWLSSISKIPSLVELYLNDCGLPPVMPISIPHMNSSASLKILGLSGNNLNSSILSWVLKVGKVLTLLDLSSNSLHSVRDGFANMTSLQYLSLDDNELDGAIIKSFRSLCQLKHLWLRSNKLSDQISDYLPQLCSAKDGLEGLGLDHNPLISGPLPDFSRFSSLKTLLLRNTSIAGALSFGKFPHHLEALDLSFNQLSGSILSFEATKFASLELLLLSHNQLNGTLPYTIGQLSNLTLLSLSSNTFNGVISEVHLSNLSKLYGLEVAQNSLSFNLSSNWVPPFQLEALYASSCILGPQFPKWLKNQRKLMVLQISNSGISDSFPQWFWGLSSSLSYLNVSHNKLNGVLPKSFPSMKFNDRLIWDFSYNNLSGPLPPFPHLYGLFLRNNMFSGSVSSFCATSPSSLTYLDLSNNFLAGPLSDCWGNFQSLNVLNLANNNLSGRITRSIGNLQNIESMHLNNNNLSGAIPSLALCSNLKFIDFGYNNLQGILPAWVGHDLQYLLVLQLRANKFHGNIPASFCNLLFLHVLDLSMNNITGEIPQCLNQIIALSIMKFPRETILYDTHPHIIIDDTESSAFVDEAILTCKGANREYGKILGLMTTIDLSHNHLTGEMPQSITALVALVALSLKSFRK